MYVKKNNKEQKYSATYLNSEENFLNQATQKKDLKLVWEWWTLPSAKKIIKEGIKETPAIYNAGVKRIKNNKIKSILESDPTNYAVKKVQGQIYNWQNA